MPSYNLVVHAEETSVVYREPGEMLYLLIIEKRRRLFRVAHYRHALPCRTSVELRHRIHEKRREPIGDDKRATSSVVPSLVLTSWP